METQQEGLGWKHNKSEYVHKHNTRLVKILHSKSMLHTSEDQTIVYNTYIVLKTPSLVMNPI
jgi:hypothetical protein